jgi:aspartyl-tRNA(Asn)/glutamyl-tRNA(Gln) amidotransferase subunit B
MIVGKPVRSESYDLSRQTAIDLNRAGTPLLEIVSEPDMRSAAEAVAFAKTLHELVQWIGICDGNMQEGSFRMDANVSVRPTGSDILGTRCEIKNLNSFRFMEKAINYEVRRQIELIEDGVQIRQETRLYDPDLDETRPMRSKEDANDYRYFPDPDLLPLAISQEQISEIRDYMPEPPKERRLRYKRDYGLSSYDALLLTTNYDLGGYFENVGLELLQAGETYSNETSKLAANWTINEVSPRMKTESESGIEGFPSWRFGVSANTSGYLLRKVRQNVIGFKTAKELFAEFWEEAKSVQYVHQGGHPQLVDELIETRSLAQISDSGAIERVIDEVLAANPRLIADYKAGKEKAFNALVGQVMKASQGKANPGQVNEILKQKLGS